MNDKPSLPLQRYDAEVKCGTWCYGGEVKLDPQEPSYVIGGEVCKTEDVAALEQYAERLEGELAEANAVHEQSMAVIDGEIDNVKALRKENVDLSAALTNANDDRVRLERENAELRE